MVEAVLSPRLHHNSHACELWCHGIAEPGDAGRSPILKNQRQPQDIPRGCLVMFSLKGATVADVV